MNFVSQILKDKGEKIWSVAPRETVYKALQIMTDQNLGALLVIDTRGGHLLGT